MSNIEDFEDAELVPARRGEVVLRVSNSTDAQKLATAVERNIESGLRVVISCVGVVTINQAVKSVAIANGRTAVHGWVILLLPTFHTESDQRNADKELTGFRFICIQHFIGG